MMENANNRIYMADLAAVLADKCDMTKKDAQKFLTDFIECIKSGVEQDRQVKIKGLGTFKVIDVGARQSVNVNTGERVLIEGHQKLTFTPDTLMKELVNKPFSHFETVILNDGIEFADEEEPEVDNIAEDLEAQEDAVQEEVEQEVQEDTAPEPQTEMEPALQEESVVSQEPESQEESEMQEEPEAQEMEHQEDMIQEDETEPVSEPLVETEQETQEEKEIVVEPEPEHVETMEKSYKWIWMILAVLACVASFAWGYWFGSKSSQQKKDAIEIEETIEVVETEPTVIEDSVAEESPLEVVTPETSEETDNTHSLQSAEQQTEPKADWQKYDEMDQRIRLGAYGIVGVKRTVTAKEGETLGRISRRELGPDMECYMEAINNMKATETLAAGQEIKIPDLVLKKKLKKELENSNN